MDEKQREKDWISLKNPFTRQEIIDTLRVVSPGRIDPEVTLPGSGPRDTVGIGPEADTMIGESRERR